MICHGIGKVFNGAGKGLHGAGKVSHGARKAWTNNVSLEAVVLPVCNSSSGRYRGGIA